MNPSQVEEKLWFGVDVGDSEWGGGWGSEVAGQATVGLTSFHPSSCILLKSVANRGAEQAINNK